MDASLNEMSSLCPTPSKDKKALLTKYYENNNVVNLPFSNLLTEKVYRLVHKDKTAERQRSCCSMVFQTAPFIVLRKSPPSEDPRN